MCVEWFHTVLVCKKNASGVRTGEADPEGEANCNSQRQNNLPRVMPAGICGRKTEDMQEMSDSVQTSKTHCGLLLVFTVVETLEHASLVTCNINHA